MSQSFRTLPRGDSFFTRDRIFYRSFFRLFFLLAFQNIVTYSVNVADNIMLGMYHQAALSGAAAVNQIQYILQQLISMGLGEGMVVLGAQFWGRRDTDSLQKVTGQALLCGWFFGFLLTVIAFAAPDKMVAVFTNDAEIIEQGTAYISIMRWSYMAFITTTLLLGMLRSIQIAGIAFRLSVMTLFLNVGINWVLIFGKLGFPEMGIRGAAIGTLIARWVELCVLVLYCTRNKKLPFVPQMRKMFGRDRKLLSKYVKVTIPCVVSSLLFAGSVAMHTVIMGHLNADAIAANSAASTLFQYCKMIPVAAAAAASVLIGKTIGGGNLCEIRSYVRTFQSFFVAIGLVFAALLLMISKPVLSLYTMNDQALSYAVKMTTVMAVTSVFTGYQMPCLIGIIRGGGDTRFVMLTDIFFGILIVIPLGLCAAFWWKWSVPAIVFCLNADQIVKAVVVTIKVQSMTWIKKLASH